MSESNQNHATHLFQVEDKTFKALMIFNLFRMAISAVITLTSFEQLIFLMENGYSLYSFMAFAGLILYVAIFFTTMTLNKNTVLLQIILLIITIGSTIIALTAGVSQIPFMDIAMTIVIYKYRHFFTR